MNRRCLHKNPCFVAATVQYILSTMHRVLSATWADKQLVPSDDGGARFSEGGVMLAASKRIVVITGCDTGFGFLSSLDLAKNGYRVISACLTQDGVTRLDQHVTLAVICDVTNEDDIAKLSAVVEKLVEEENLCLWAVINNAGIAPLGYIDWLPMTVIRKAMEVPKFVSALITST